MVAPSKELSPWGKAIAGSAAAIVANSLVYPLDIIKTKLQVQSDNRYDGVSDAFKKIYAREGLRGLYTGLTGSLIGVASTNFAYFYWYGLVRGMAMKRWGRNISTPMELALGAIAGALAQIFTIPVSVVTTRQQTSSDKKEEGKKPDGLIKTTKNIIAEDGVSALWTGLKASLILVVNPSITYGSFERLKAVLFPGKLVLNSYENFIIGALAKVMATLVTQPLIVAKVMQQSASKKYKTFMSALRAMVQQNGLKGLYKGIGPQISKAVIVQGLLFMFKDQVELLIVLLFRFFSKRRIALR
ncbi:peroxisomal adenine nucleotide transporter 1 [Trichomonascus vanleenenianus]|uniref:Ant1p n=1 Tax=Trichomonascus vanleenenianus TaxID=2268995 RepID=UPI003ECB5579